MVIIRLSKEELQATVLISWYYFVACYICILSFVMVCCVYMHEVDGVNLHLKFSLDLILRDNTVSMSIVLFFSLLYWTLLLQHLWYPFYLQTTITVKVLYKKIVESVWICWRHITNFITLVCINKCSGNGISPQSTESL